MQEKIERVCEQRLFLSFDSPLPFFQGQRHSLVNIRLHLHSLHIFLNFLNAAEMHVLFDHFNWQVLTRGSRSLDCR